MPQMAEKTEPDDRRIVRCSLTFNGTNSQAGYKVFLHEGV